ncbi:unnamed protein product [Lathyrus oleraceus]
MTFNNYQSYLLGVSYVALVLVSGLVTSLKTQTVELRKASCFIGAPGKVCCFEDCSPNCGQDCIKNGFILGGVCVDIAIGEKCCCIK